MLPAEIQRVPAQVRPGPPDPAGQHDRLGGRADRGRRRAGRAARNPSGTSTSISQRRTRSPIPHRAASLRPSRSANPRLPTVRLNTEPATSAAATRSGSPSSERRDEEVAGGRARARDGAERDQAGREPPQALLVARGDQPRDGAGHHRHRAQAAQQREPHRDGCQQRETAELGRPQEPRHDGREQRRARDVEHALRHQQAGVADRVAGVGGGASHQRQAFYPGCDRGAVDGSGRGRVRSAAMKQTSATTPPRAAATCPTCPIRPTSASSRCGPSSSAWSCASSSARPTRTWACAPA